MDITSESITSPLLGKREAPSGDRDDDESKDKPAAKLQRQSTDEAKTKQPVADSSCPRNDDCAAMKRLLVGKFSETDLEHLETM